MVRGLVEPLDGVQRLGQQILLRLGTTPATRLRHPCQQTILPLNLRQRHQRRAPFRLDKQWTRLHRGEVARSWHVGQEARQTVQRTATGDWHPPFPEDLSRNRALWCIPRACGALHPVKCTTAVGNAPQTTPVQRRRASTRQGAAQHMWASTRHVRRLWPRRAARRQRR